MPDSGLIFRGTPQQKAPTDCRRNGSRDRLPPLPGEMPPFPHGQACSHGQTGIFRLPNGSWIGMGSPRGPVLLDAIMGDHVYPGTGPLTSGCRPVFLQPVSDTHGARSVAGLFWSWCTHRSLQHPKCVNPLTGMQGHIIRCFATTNGISFSGKVTEISHFPAKFPRNEFVPDPDGSGSPIRNPRIKVCWRPRGIMQPQTSFHRSPSSRHPLYAL